MEEKLDHNATWRKICYYEKNLYSNLKPKPEQELLFNHNERMKVTRPFVKVLTEILPPEAKVLDLGGTGVPWFSYVCAESKMRVFTYDIQEPKFPNSLKEKNIKYIKDDVNNIDNYMEDLGEFDFIFCDSLSPPQKLVNWYEPDFVKLWKPP